MKLIKYLIFYGFIIFAPFFLGFSYSAYRYFNTPIVIKNTFLIVQKGDSFKRIVKRMQNQGLIENNDLMARIFYYTSLVINKNKINVKAGEYLILTNDSPLVILNKLKNGDVFFRKLTFAEGLSTHSILKIIDSSYGLVGDLPRYEVPEGGLLPETYLYSYGDTKIEIINRMQRAMSEFVNGVWSRKMPHSPVNSKEELISLASIVEKETGVPEERGRVASVFTNRLKKGMRLQSDPTAVYAYTKGNVDLEDTISTAKLIRIPSEYNTYTIRGIPKKPIANPGKDSILAVLNPDKTDYEYFVATGNGGHHFSKTYAEHRKFIESYRKALRKQRSK